MFLGESTIFLLQTICFGVINCSIFCWCVWVFCFFSAISNLIDSGERKVYPCVLSYLTNTWAAIFLRTETQQVCQIVGYLCIAIANILNIACLTIHLDRFFLQHISPLPLDIRLNETIKTPQTHWNAPSARCHKSVRGTSKWVKRELLEMEEGRSKEEAKHLLKVKEHQGTFWLPTGTMK